MRRIGQLERREAAETFSDYLALHEISNEIDADGEAFVIWVHDDPRLETARRMLDEFLEDPRAVAYSDASREMRQRRQEIVRKEARRRLEASAAEAVADQEAERQRTLPKFTIIIALVCGVVAYHSQLGENLEPIAFLFLSEFVSGPGPFSEVLGGQIWRLVTPIFIHLGFMHIVFNLMLWMDLGGAVERVKGTGYLTVLTLVIAVCSNVGQYLVSGPSFGGLSGVVYGLFGFIWMQSRFDRGSGFAIRMSTVWFLGGWFVICLTGLIPGVANWAHGVGLGLGMSWGFVAAKSRTRRR